MKRYYILAIKSTERENKKTGFIDYKFNGHVVSVMGEAIGDNLFYRKKKWCGVDYLELNDARTGTYICRIKTLEDLETYVASEEFKNQLDKVRKSDFYKFMLERYKKAVEEYDERVKGGKKK